VVVLVIRTADGAIRVDRAVVGCLEPNAAAALELDAGRELVAAELGTVVARVLERGVKLPAPEGE
jgi:hypothetical protein